MFLATVHFADPRFTQKLEIAEVRMFPSDRSWDGEKLYMFLFKGRIMYCASLETRSLGTIWLVVA